MQSQEPATIRLMMPSQVIINMVKMYVAWITQFCTQAALHLGTYPLDATLLNDIFQTRMLTIRPVSIVAQYGNDALNGLEHLVRCNISQRGSQARVGLGLAKCCAHSSTHEHGEAHQFVVFDLRHQPNILREHVDTVVVGISNSYLELTCEIGGTIHWLDIFFRLPNAAGLLTINPDLMVRTSTRCQMHRQSMSGLLNLRLHTVGYWRGTGHDVSVDISTGRQRREQRFINVIQHRTYVALEHSV